MNQKVLKHQPHIIYTIGHSTYSFTAFLLMLQAFQIKTLIDIRALPGSRKFPQYDKDDLAQSLTQAGIQYVYLKSLGGRRKTHKQSKNSRWKNTSFQAYADYMETPAFEEGIKDLEQMAKESLTVIMCAEAVWWRCHRSMIADYLKAKGWEVRHIMHTNKATEHPYTSSARVVGDRVFYDYEDN